MDQYGNRKLVTLPSFKDDEQCDECVEDHSLFPVPMREILEFKEVPSDESECDHSHNDSSDDAFEQH